MQLSPQQLSFIDTFGYLHLPGLLDDRISRITEEFELIWSNNSNEHNRHLHDGTARSCIVPLIDQSEYLSSLIDNQKTDKFSIKDYENNSTDTKIYFKIIVSDHKK